ncbi:dehydrogenase/reductase SDR family member 7B [Capsaspora owczarzaki ATCC 30864]|uniref:Dehydrogenase/reductase SDR family member 7B n=1 Tax=Capsaspora owczarzaki (strain ATCC 30864) TaxID=595528 RepID=A0A0D2WR22_CAPO3|nr:dehydrogenase/reductase SDR family member 7B [Capsaspora owczarzaki ATCC 30864]KJE93568.1 dehydrogenase/reductase SDR family member 7B [Capsaspora owczarzaki ATCC 30864]|eukprot:XP_004348163.1 dehydrogenase/reductase SDR family member 7B [Capsaspora owczarzaki ATCC 30864]
MKPWVWAALAALVFLLHRRVLKPRREVAARRSYFRGKVVWLTGASSGIGEALAMELYKCGATLILSSRRTAELERVRQQCIAQRLPAGIPTPPEPRIVALDLAATPDAIASATRIVLAQYSGVVDVLINNSGISTRASVLESQNEMEARVMQVNFFGAAQITKLVLPGMLARGTGHIGVVSSVQGKLGIGFRSAYAASKHAVHGYFDSLRAEVAGRGLRVTLCCPGYVQTNLSLNALTGDGSAHGQMDETTAKGYKPSFVAEKMLSSMALNRTELVLAPLDARLAILLRYLLPDLLARLMAKRAEKQRRLEQAPAGSR